MLQLMIEWYKVIGQHKYKQVRSNFNNNLKLLIINQVKDNRKIKGNKPYLNLIYQINKFQIKWNYFIDQLTKLVDNLQWDKNSNNNKMFWNLIDFLN